MTSAQHSSPNRQVEPGFTEEALDSAAAQEHVTDETDGELLDHPADTEKPSEFKQIVHSIVAEVIGADTDETPPG